MIFRIDPGSDIALFTQVAAAVRSQMAEGKLEPGDRLPAAREVAASLDINVHTVLRAYQDLREEGLVEMRRGRGVTVTAAAGAVAALAADARALARRAVELGLSPATLAALMKETPDDR